LGPPFTGHFRILVDTPRGLAPLHPGSRPDPTVVRKDVFQTDPANPSAPDVRLALDEAAAFAAAADAAPSSDPTAAVKPCSTCGTTATAIRYSSIKRRGEISVCAPCYTEGRFPSSLSAGDFVKLDTAYLNTTVGSGWTDQETLLLLEGLEMYEDDWDKVAEHVGTKNKEQSIMHFLKMPIEDPFLEATAADLGPLQYARLPFSQEDNPVMSVLAFLASAVDKDVVAKAAGISIDEMEKGLKARAAQAGVDVKGKESEGEAGGDVSMEGGEEKEDDPTVVARNNIEKAAIVAFGAAAAKSHVLALEEDASLHSLVTSVVEAQVRKLELKMAHFEELERLLETERKSVELTRQQVYEDRLRVARLTVEVQALHERAKQGLAIKPQEIAHMVAGSVSGNTTTEVGKPGGVPEGMGQYVNMTG
jgi:SWI/SNF related-matrix-associated actin-dependent regulator of chromatin subfamily C